MTDQLRQAAQKALYEWDNMSTRSPSPFHVCLAMEALRTALKQQTEPVCPDCKAAVLYECVGCSSNNYPPQRKPLTDEEIKAKAMEAFNCYWDGDDETLVNKYGHGVYMSRFTEFARAVEAAHGIKEGT